MSVSTVACDVNATILPVVGDTIDSATASLLERGCRGILLGETREEYVARRMSVERRARETADDVRELIQHAQELAGAPLLVAVDQELGGIQRLHNLVPPLPSPDAAATMQPTELVERVSETAAAMRSLGVTVNLAPILDVMTGRNPWLDNRHLGGEPQLVARIGEGFIEGMQRGGVAAAAKHFPGHRGLLSDPAVEPATVPDNRGDGVDDLLPFRAAIDAGAKAVMMGPAVVPAIDPDAPASLSPIAHQVLRTRLGFTGLIISDDLDAVAIIGTGTLVEAGERALRAGADLLLVGGGPQLKDLCRGLERAVAEHRLSAERVSQAAASVRALADRLGQRPD